MAIFGSSKAKPRAESPTGGLSVIAVGMTVRGDVDSDGVVKVEGRVDGNVRARNQVLVARQGVVVGDIETREAIIGGTVQGTITSSERVEIQAGAAVLGDLVTVRIAVSEGGRIDGRIRMRENAGELSPPADVKAVPVGGPAPGQVSAAPIARPSVPLVRVAVPPRLSHPGSGR